MHVNLSESDSVTFEDAGAGDGGGGGGDDDVVVLANRSILTKGLVVRSRSNRFTVRLSSRSPGAGAGSLRLRYRGTLGRH